MSNIKKIKKIYNILKTIVSKLLSCDFDSYFLFYKRLKIVLNIVNVACSQIQLFCMVSSHVAHQRGKLKYSSGNTEAYIYNTYYMYN